MAKLRPELITSKDGRPCPRNGTAYLLVYEAVKQQSGLIHGKINGAHGKHCAIGSYFAQHERTALPSELIDEVAMVNDSVPNATPRQRKMHVTKWLHWKLKQLGM